MRNRDTDRRKDTLEIVFEDDWLIVVNKPSGLLTMSAGPDKPQHTAYSMLHDYVNGKENGKRIDRHGLFIVHRLDRDTSGLIVFAKDEDTKRALQDNWEEVVLERKYIAVLEGDIEDDEGWVETWLFENPKSLKVHAYPIRKEDDINRPPRKGWMYASTHCRTVKHLTIEGKPYTMAEFNLETGKKNQIRVHARWIGHPIAGDRKYDAQTDPFGRLALHSAALTFIHPWTGKEMRFTAPLPRKLRTF